MYSGDKDGDGFFTGLSTSESAHVDPDSRSREIPPGTPPSLSNVYSMLPSFTIVASSERVRLVDSAPHSIVTETSFSSSISIDDERRLDEALISTDTHSAPAPRRRSRPFSSLSGDPSDSFDTLKAARLDMGEDGLPLESAPGGVKRKGSSLAAAGVHSPLAGPEADPATVPMRGM